MEKQKMEIDIEIRSLSDKIKEGSIKADEAKKTIRGIACEESRN